MTGQPVDSNGGAKFGYHYPLLQYSCPPRKLVRTHTSNRGNRDWAEVGAFLRKPGSRGFVTLTSLGEKAQNERVRRLLHHEVPLVRVR